ncbi:MAG: ATP-binding protein [Lachnospiraceae bacterium]|nr:ATP-binding protein [Lachnospiraceae bacterium]
MKHAGTMILYCNLEQGQIFEDMTWIMEHYKSDYYDRDDIRSLCFESFHNLVELAASHGFEGNLWHNYLTLLIVNNENAYSRACENRGGISGTINELARHDFAVFQELFAFDFQKLVQELQIPELLLLKDYQRSEQTARVFNHRIRDRICDLSVRLEQARSVEEFQMEVTKFYGEFGVGKLGLHKAFRIEHEDQGARIVPITNIAHVHLSDLVGYEREKRKLIDNTEAFVQGKQANNCLLFGDAGTGKSTSIKAIINQYYEQGLRMIEVYKHQFQDLNSVIAQIKNRNYKFIIYMDDLSFEEFEVEYKYLKAVIEGGLEKKPDNVLIYATSNRRHLVREKFSDKEERDDELHTRDTVQEKLSLVSRFGVTIYFGSPDKKEFHEIVRRLAEKHQIYMEEETLLLEADRWELNHGGPSGRCAQQFINALMGREQTVIGKEKL